MKANFNIAKNVRNSRSISALGALRKLHGLGLLLCALLIGSLQVWGADEVYKTAKFGTQADSGTNSDYTSTWTSTYNSFSVEVANGNTNGTTWDLVKFGRKNYTSIGEITTVAKIDKAVTKVVLTMSAITGSKVNSIKLYTSSNGSSWTEQGSYTKSSGAQTVNLASPTANLYYKIEFDCQSNSSNGFISVTQVDYYIASGPTLYTVTFDANGGSVTPASATQASAGASIALPTPTRDGYNCTGWYTATSGGTKRGDAGGSYTPTSSETIHAQWSERPLTNYRTRCCIELPAPTNPNETPSNDGGTLYWDAVVGATGYEVNIDGGGWASTGNGTNCSYTVTGKACGGTSVSWQVRATGDGTTNCAAGAPTTVRNFSTSSCSCTGTYSFHYQHSGAWNAENICFSPVAGATNNYLTDELSLPYAENYKVAWQGVDQSYTSSTGFNGNMPFFHNRDKKFGANPQSGNLGGGKGKFHVYHDSGSTNKYVSFIPTGYTLNFGTGDTWTNDSTKTFTGKTNAWDETEWYTDLITLKDGTIGKKIFVGLQTTSGYVWCDPYSQKDNLTGLRTKTGADSWLDGGMSTSYAEKTGKFRIYANSGDKNWYVTFVPYYRLTYNANSGTGAPSASGYVSCEGNAAARTIAISATEPTRVGYRFMGWATSAERAAAGTVDYKHGTANDEVVLTGSLTLFAVWKQLYTVTYDYDGGSGSCSGGSYIEGETVTVCASTPTKAGSDFAGWSYSPSVTVTTGTFPMPGSNVAITATWTDHTYTLTHAGTGTKTNTENKTTIKSSDTPLTLHYTCTGTNAFPLNDVSVSGGGKASWTRDTHFTWEVGSDKQTATLVITPATTITADVTITINMKTRYTVIWDEHGVLTTEYYASDDNTVAEKTGIADCGEKEFYRWTEDAEFVSDDDTPPTEATFGTISGNKHYYAIYADAVVPANPGYVKITSGATAGTYIIVTDGGTAYAGRDGSNDRGTYTTGLTISDGVIASKGSATEVTITMSGSNFYMNDGTYYLGYSGSSNDLKFDASKQDGNKDLWKLDANGQIESVNVSGRKLEYNSGSPRFACYTGSGVDAFLFKKETTTYEKFSKTCETYDITIDPGITGGTVTTTPAAGTDVAGEGQEITVNVTPNSCKYLSALSYNDGEDDHAISIASTPYTFTMPANDVTVTATFSNKSVSSIAPITNSHRILMEGTSFVGEDIRVTYNNGETEDLAWNASGLSFTGYNMSTLGNQTVTVNYTSDCGNANTSYSIEITDGIPVTFSDCGNTTLRKYDPGDVVPVETISGEYACAGWVFAGWSETSVAANSTSYTPVSNFSASTAKTLYAVYSKEGSTWLSAFDLSEMRSGAKYVIVKNYSAGNQFALTNAADGSAPNYLDGSQLATDCEAVREPGTYNDRYRLTVTPTASMIWVVKRKGEHWTIYSPDAEKYLKITSDGYTQLTTACEDEFVLTEGYNDSEIDAESTNASGKHLSWYNSSPKYWNGYGSAASKVYWLTNNEQFSSTPPCAPRSVEFHGNGGTVIAKTGTPTGDDLTITEASRDAGIYLPTAETDAASCDGKEWNFVGWIDHEVDVTRVPVLTTDMLNDGYDALNPNPHYDITADDEEYWAVYTNTGDPETKYGTISFTMSDFPKSYNVSEETLTKTVGGVGSYDFAYYQVGHASELGIQINHDPAGYLKNTTSLGKINKITFSSFGAGTISNIQVYVGNTADAINTLLPSSCLQTVSGVSTYYPNGNYQFVKIQYTAYTGVGTISIDFGRGTEVWATTPECSALSLSGTVRVTSTNGKRVKAVTPITVSGHGLAANAPVTIAAYNVSDDTPNTHFTFIGSASADANGDVTSTNIVIAYQPTETSDGIEEVYFKASASNGSGTTESGKLTGYGRHLPAKFVIATKVGGNWYALPNNVTTASYGTRDLIPITVDNTTTPTTATVYSSTTDYLAWGLNAAGTSTDRYTTDGEKISFVSAINSKGLAGNASGLRNSAALPATTSGDYLLFDWKPSTTDLGNYTLQNGSVTTYYVATNGSDQWTTATTGADVRFLIYDKQPAPTITWQNDMLESQHAQNTAENALIILPTGADPVSCNSTLLPTFCGWKDGAIATYVTSEPTYVQAGDAATTDKTYYAVFKHATLDRWYTDCPTIYTITYTANGGTGADHLEYTMNTTADAITVGAAGFSKEGCTFVGWTNPDDVDGTIITPGAGKITGLTGDITLNAVWIGTTTVTGTVRLTASAGEKVATGATEITISSTDFACATALRITYKDVTNDVTYGRSGTPSYTSSEFRLCNGSYGAADLSNISLAEVSGAYNQTYSITYEPNGGANTLDHYQLKIEVLLKNTVIETKTLELYGRTLPASFAIATKIGGAWYALPNNMGSEGTYDPILISVTEDANVLNWTAQGPSTAAYKMKDYTVNYSRLRFAANDANQYCLWAANGDAAGIRNWSASSTDAAYGWIVAETNADFSGYTMATSNNTRTGLMISNNKWEMANSGYSEIHFIPLTTVETIDIIAREWKTNGLVFAIAADNNVSLTSGHTKYGVNAAPTTNVTSITRHSTGGYGLYEVGLADITGDYGKVLSLKMKIGGVDKIANVTIPIIVSGTDVTTDASEPFTTLDAATKDYDVVILEGAKLTTKATALHASKFHNLYVYAGGTLINDNGSTSVNYLEMRGGIKGVAHKEDLAQGVPHLRLNKQISSTNGANLDMYVNTAHSYALSVPFEVSLSGVNYANSLNTSTGAAINGTLDSQFRIMRYDGETRSTGASGWTPITSTSYTLQVGQGYVLQGKRPKGQPFAVIRFPFTGVNNWADSNGEGKASGKPAIDIYAHEGGANTPDNDKGWNLIANPYMATISYYGDEEEAYAADFTVGCLEKTNTTPWDGKYSYTETTDAYVTMPNDWYSAFPQYRANSAQAVFEPFKNFFIQTSADGSVLFDRSKRASAPRHLLAQTENVSPIYADINLTHGDDFAQAGLKIDANATTGYKFGEDQNIFENREALTYLKVYTVADGHYLVGNTLTPAETAELIPLEFYAPNINGDYVFSLDANSDIDRLEYVILYDAELGLNTNLLTNDYTVELEQTGLIENRFSIGLKVKEKDNSATGIDDVGGDSERPYKFIYRDKMYILRGGKIYDATGKQVREIK